MCVYECMCACVHAYVCACMYSIDREGSWIFASLQL